MKSKWLILPLYRPDRTPGHHAITSICSLGFYSDKYENILVLGDFNMTDKDNALSPLIDGHLLYSMIKEQTCFKNTPGRCIDLILTNRKYSFQYTQTFETGMSDHHVMIYTIFKTRFVKIPPKRIDYRCYSKFSKDLFFKDLSESYEFTSFEEQFTNILNMHDLEIAECMNTYFVNISKTMDIKKWPEQCPCIDSDDIIAKAIHKYENHPSIITIKYNIGEIVNKFELEQILPEYVYDKIKQLDASKSGKIPTKIIKDSVDICCNLITDYFNTSIYDWSFPKSMKLGDITPVFKDDEKVYKENYRPVCTLSPFSKVFERILGEQINP